MQTNPYKDIAAIIPVREGSSRVKDKVLLPFENDLNLTEWKVEQIKKVLPSENIFVSTDSPRLHEMAHKQGVQIHERDPFLCKGHDATFSEVITGIVKDIPFTHIAWVTVVVPLMSPQDFDSGFSAYNKNVLQNKTHDSLVSVNLLKEYFWDEKGPLNYRADKNHTISQELPNFYRVTNGLYMRDKESILRDGYFLGPNPYMHQVGKIAGIDIDEWEDYQIAKALLPIYHEQQSA